MEREPASDARLQQALAAVIRAAEAESVRAHGASRPEVDRLAIADLLDGADPRTADVLALVARTPILFDAIAQVAQVHRLSEQLEERRRRAQKGGAR